MEAVVTTESPVREINCPVRVGMQGYGSVELYLTTYGEPRWHTLDELMKTPTIRSVTFSGPWRERRINVGGFEQPVDSRRMGGIEVGTPVEFPPKTSFGIVPPEVR